MLEKGCIVCSITHRIWSWRLRPASLSRDDDLVYGQDGAGCLGGQFDGPTLGDHEIQNAVVFGVESSGAVVVLWRLGLVRSS